MDEFRLDVVEGVARAIGLVKADEKAFVSQYEVRLLRIRHGKSEVLIENLCGGGRPRDEIDKHACLCEESMVDFCSLRRVYLLDMMWLLLWIQRSRLNRLVEAVFSIVVYCTNRACAECFSGARGRGDVQTSPAHGSLRFSSRPIRRGGPDAP